MEESEQSEEDSFAVELITRARVFNGNWQYYVKWDGYGSDEDTWEPAVNLAGCRRLLGSFWKEAKRDNQDYVEGTVVAASKSWIEKERRWFARQKANAGRRPRRNAATPSFDGSESDEAQSHHHTAVPKVAYRPSASTPAEQSEQATINSSTSSAEQQRSALLRSRNPALSFSPLPSAEELNLELEREPEQQKYSLNSQLIRRKVITVCAEFYEEVGALFKRTDPSVLSLCYPDDVDPLHLIATGKLRLQQVEEAAPSLAANTGITKPGERWHEIFLAPTLRSDPESADVGVHSTDANAMGPNSRAIVATSATDMMSDRSPNKHLPPSAAPLIDHHRKRLDGGVRPLDERITPAPADPAPAPDAVPVVVNGILAAPNDPEHAVNGVLDDPATPVSNAVASEPKIDIDVPEQESDVRHEALPHTLEPAHASNGVNSTNSDVSMHDVDLHSPATMPVDGPPASSNGASTSHTSPADQDDDQPPPAKRPRILSDTDKASLTHCATPPPASVTSNGVSQAPTPSGRPTLDMGQWRFCISAIRSLKKQKDAPPFLHPVDPFALGIPHYHSIVRNPMDLSTIERKLASSNPSKPDPNAETPCYLSSDEFIADVRLVVKNCLLFNGADHPISAMAQRLEEVFDKQIKNLPLLAEAIPGAIVKKVPPPLRPPTPVKKAQPPRRASTSMPVIRSSDTTEVVSRPKREIRPPPPKGLAYADIPKKRKTRRVKDDGTAEQLKFCSTLLALMNRKQHYGIASLFYEPVDHVFLDIPTYPKIVEKPMDLSTMRKKLDNREYPTASKFHDDFKLMIRNCFAFNPSGTLVNQAGIELQRLFDQKWQGLPPLHEVSEDDNDDEDEESDDEDTRRIALMESQLELMRENIQALKGKAKEKKKKERRDKGLVASPSKSSSSEQIKGLPNNKKGKKPVYDNDVLTFEQMKHLSEAIAQLDGQKLERVIKIVHEGVPEIKDSTGEIELEIDQLPTSVLTKLYNFVLRPLRAPATKRNRTTKGAGAGGLKRKSMDEDVEAEKICMLETRMALFEQGGSAAAGHIGSGRSSECSDSSGSGSE